MTTRQRLTSALAVVGIAVASLSAAPAGNAAQLESGRFDFSESNTFDNCGFDIRGEAQVSGKFTISKGTARSGGEYFRAKQLTSVRSVFTNVETGASFTEDYHTNFREMPATVIDESGPIVTYQTKESGVWATIRDSTGKVRYRATGTVVFQYDFDTGGDGAPGGEFLSAEFIGTFGNWQIRPDLDWCAMADELIG